MTRIMAIDPGKNALGIALFSDDELDSVFLVRGEPHTIHDDMTKQGVPRGWADICVVEKPQVDGRTPGRVKDLLWVAVTAGAGAAASGAPVVKYIEPRDWKGSREKKVDNRFTRSLLSIRETRLLHCVDAPTGLVHNVVDGIGIGLWHVGRR